VIKFFNYTHPKEQSRIHRTVGVKFFQVCVSSTAACQSIWPFQQFCFWPILYMQIARANNWDGEMFFQIPKSTPFYHQNHPPQIHIDLLHAEFPFQALRCVLWFFWQLSGEKSVMKITNPFSTYFISG